MDIRQNIPPNNHETMNTPEHLPSVATRRGLNGYFVDFHLLPELFRQRGKDAIQRNWAEFLKHTDHDEHY